MGIISRTGKFSGGVIVKASEIFLKYVEPLMNEITSDHSEEYLQKTLSFPGMVWNSMVMQEWGQSKTDYIQAMRDHLKSAPDDVRKISDNMINMWIKRKMDFFPSAKWAFEITVRKGKEGPIIRALTRIPDHLRHTVPKDWQTGNIGKVEFRS